MVEKIGDYSPKNVCGLSSFDPYKTNKHTHSLMMPSIDPSARKNDLAKLFRPHKCSGYIKIARRDRKYSLFKFHKGQIRYFNRITYDLAFQDLCHRKSQSSNFISDTILQEIKFTTHRFLLQGRCSSCVSCRFSSLSLVVVITPTVLVYFLSSTY